MKITSLPSEILSLVLAQLCLVRNIKGTKRTCRAFCDAAPEAEKALLSPKCERLLPLRSQSSLLFSGPGFRVHRTVGRWYGAVAVRLVTRVDHGVRP